MPTPCPSDLAERIKFAITVHALHAEVAELMDSALLTTRGADAKVEPTPTDSVTFTAASVSLMVSASPSERTTRRPRAGRRLGHHARRPGRGGDHRGQHARSISDANGRFVLDDLPHGPVHFVITDPDNEDMRPVITPTIQI